MAFQRGWRTAFSDARAELKRAEDQTKLVQLKLNQANLDYLQKTDVYNKENKLGPEITALKAQLADEQENVEKAKKKIDDLEEELRRSGGLPGWAR